jgi:serine/threonine-protein kinase
VPDEDPRAIEARKACVSGQVERGIQLLADYLATTDDVIAVYNMGRCYQQNGLPDKALLQFREYLRKARNLSGAERADVEAQIRELEGERRASPTGNVPEDRRADSLRPVGIVLAAAGVASVGVGIYFGVHARSLEDKVTAAPRFDPSDDSAGRTAHTLQFVMYGIGAAAIAGGAVLYYLGLGSRHRVALLPGLAPRAAGAMVRIRL